MEIGNTHPPHPITIQKVSIKKTQSIIILLELRYNKQDFSVSEHPEQLQDEAHMRGEEGEIALTI